MDPRSFHNYSHLTYRILHTRCPPLFGATCASIPPIKAVAPIVGRADLLCGFLSVIALSLTIVRTGGRINTSSGRRGHSKEFMKLELSHSRFRLGYSEEEESRSDSFSNSGGNNSGTDINNNNNNSHEKSTSAIRTKEGSRSPSTSSATHGSETIKVESKTKKSVQSTAENCNPYGFTNPPAAEVAFHISMKGATASSTAGMPTVPVIGTETPSRLRALRLGAGSSLTTAGTGVRVAVGDVSRGGDTTSTTDDEDEENDDTNDDTVGQVLATLISHRECSVTATRTTQDSPITRAAAAGNPARGRTMATPEAAPIAAAYTVPGKKATSSAVALGTKLDGVAKAEVEQEREVMEEEGENKVRERGKIGPGTTAHRQRAAGTASTPVSAPRPDPTVAAIMHPRGHNPSTRVGGAGVVKEENDTGPGLLIFCTALVFTAGATLCKEVGVTVFGVIAGGEVVRVFEERSHRLQRRSSASTAGLCQIWPNQLIRAPVAAAARIASAVTCAALLIFLHVRLHGGAGIREWGVLENDISVLER